MTPKIEDLLPSFYGDSSHLAEGSREVQEIAMRLFVRWLKQRKIAGYVSEINTALINDWRRDCLKAGNNPNYIRNKWNILRKFLHWCERRGHLQEYPIESRKLLQLSRPQTHRPLFTLRQYEALLEMVGNRYLYRPYWKTLFMLGYHTGMRLHDCCFTLWSQVDFERETFHVTPRKTRRYNQFLQIPIEPELMAHFREIYPLRNPLSKTNRMLPDLAGLYEVARDSLTLKLRNIFTEARLPHRFHSFRHTFDSRLINAGVAPKIVSEMTGQSLATLERYTHVNHQAKVNALAQSREAMFKAKLHEMGIEPNVQ